MATAVEETMAVWPILTLCSTVIVSSKSSIMTVTNQCVISAAAEVIQISALIRMSILKPYLNYYFSSRSYKRRNQEVVSRHTGIYKVDH